MPCEGQGESRYFREFVALQPSELADQMAHSHGIYPPNQSQISLEDEQPVPVVADNHEKVTIFGINGSAGGSREGHGE